MASAGLPHAGSQYQQALPTVHCTPHAARSAFHDASAAAKHWTASHRTLLCSAQQADGPDDSLVEALELCTATRAGAAPTLTVMQLALWLSLRAMSKALMLKAGSVNLQQPWLVMDGRGVGLLGLVMHLCIHLESPESAGPHLSHGCAPFPDPPERACR